MRVRVAAIVCGQEGGKPLAPACVRVTFPGVCFDCSVVFLQLPFERATARDMDVRQACLRRCPVADVVCVSQCLQPSNMHFRSSSCP